MTNFSQYMYGSLFPKDAESAIQQGSSVETMAMTPQPQPLPSCGNNDQYSPQRKRYAVLVDCENAQAAAMELVLQELQRKFHAQIDVRRAYGDFSLQPLMEKWKMVCSEQSFLPVHTFTFVKGKGTSDATLIMDAMELLYDTSRNNNNKLPLDGFCIVSSDSDFTRLAQRLRESGKHVVGVGQGHTLDPFVKACDTFIFVNELMERHHEQELEQQQAAELAKQQEQLQEKVQLANEIQRQQQQQEQQEQQEQQKIGTGKNSLENAYLTIYRLFGFGTKKRAIPPEKLHALHSVILKHRQENDYCNISVIGNTIRPELYGYDRIGDLVADYPDDFETMRDDDKSVYVKSLKNELMIQNDLSRMHKLIEDLSDGNGWAEMGIVGSSNPVDVSLYGSKKLSLFLRRFPNEFEIKIKKSKCFVKSVRN